MTVYETVKLRPDLAVQDLTFPITAIVQQVVNIRASISELNGDAGATITCVLAIDGTNLDQANTVYVDAGGGVTCEFSHTFSTAGTHSIQVTAANPVPGDWDLSNNTAAASITISAANTEHATALFLDSNVNGPLQKQTYQLSYQGNAVYSYSSFGSSVHLQGSSTLLQDYGCTGSTNAASWNLPVSISYTESMDGTQLYSFSDSGLSASGPSLAVVPFPLCSSTAESVVAQYGSNLKNDHFAYIGYVQYLDSTGNPLYSLQFVGVQREAGDVTYFSHVYQCSLWSNCSNPADYYSWNTSDRTPSLGNAASFGHHLGSERGGSRRFGKNACRKFERPAH